MRQQLRCVLASTAMLLAGSAAMAQDERGRPPATSPGGLGEQGAEPRTGDPISPRAPRPQADNPADRAREQSARDEEKFVKEAAIAAAGQAEVSRLAAQKASASEVRQFAQLVAEEQGKASDQLKALASQKSIAVPAEIDGKHKKALERLSKASPDEFDREYMKRMLDDHRDGVSDFRKAANSPGASDVKMFAAQTLPKLEEHLRLAQQFEQANRRETRGTTGTFPPEGPRPGPDPLGRPETDRGQPDPSGRPGAPPNPSPDAGGDRGR